jgi:hypothetical protein
VSRQDFSSCFNSALTKITIRSRPLRQWDMGVNIFNSESSFKRISCSCLTFQCSYARLFFPPVVGRDNVIVNVYIRFVAFLSEAFFGWRHGENYPLPPIPLGASARGTREQLLYKLRWTSKVAGSIPTAVKQSFQLARCGHTQRQHHKRISSLECIQ